MIKKHSTKGMALSQIIIILLGTVAFSYIIGSEIGFASAATPCTFTYTAGGVLRTYTTTADSAGTVTVSGIGCDTSTPPVCKQHTYTRPGTSWIRDDGVAITEAAWIASANNCYTQVTTTACGASGQACCTGSTCNAGLTCTAGQCSATTTTACGASGETCCATSPVCDTTDLECKAGICSAKTTQTACGASGQTCCATTPACNAGLECLAGICSTQVTGSCTAAGGTPMITAACTSAGGTDLNIPSGTGLICCKLTIVPPSTTNAAPVSPSPTTDFSKTCAQLGGAICLLGQPCSGGTLVSASDALVSNCCVGSTCAATTSGGAGGAAGATGGLAALGNLIGKNIGGIIASLGYAAAVFAGLQVLRDWLETQGIGGAGTFGGAALGAFQWAATGFTLIATLPAEILGAVGLTWFTGGLIGAGLALAIFLIIYREYRQDAVLVTCIPWQAPTGGDDCKSCGQNGIECTSYQCASLGTECELINSETGQGKPMCVRIEQDLTPPTISFLNVLPSGYAYEPVDPPAEYPEDTGVLITYNNGEIPYYTSLPVGVTTDDISKCKMDYIRGTNYSDMSSVMFGGLSENEGVWGRNHTLSVPVLPFAGGEVNMYVRCENRGGHSDVNAFVIQFVVSTEPDRTPPKVEGTDILSGSPVAFGTTSLNVRVYISEPVNGCKWSHNNYDYNNMENSMTCPNTMNMQGIFAGKFPCTATLTGLNDGVANNFHFLCSDTAGNTATQDYPFIIMGTQELAITSVSPANGTVIKDSTDSVKVTLNAATAAGYNQGQAYCEYSTSGSSGSYKIFDSDTASQSYQHSTELWLPAGSYNYYIRCTDDGSNRDVETVNFQIEIDKEAPAVVRVSHENANLNIKTNEEAKCVYDIVDCSYPFDKGISMLTSADKKSHTTSWVAGRTYYIKCKDSFGNNPQNDCSITLSPSQF